MKILLVSTQDYIHHPVPSRHHYIFEELAKRHKVHVPHFHVSRGKERKTRLIVHEATKFAITEPFLHYTLNAPFHYAVFKRIIREEKIDIVVASHILAGTAVIQAAKNYGIPVVFDLKDWYPDSVATYYKNRVLRWFLSESVWRITKHNLDRSDCITTVSPSLVERLQNFGYDARLITNGVDTDIFKPMDSSEGKRRLGLETDSFVIGYVGTLEGWLDLDTVFKALSELQNTEKNIHLAIIGGGLFTDYEKRLKQVIKEENIENIVYFYGIKEYGELPKYIAGMDVCLIPFKITPVSDISLPNKFFEYSACGKPILSTPIQDVIKTRSENLFIYYDQDEFVKIVKYLLRNRRNYNLTIDGYSWKRKASEFESLLNEIIEEKK